MMASTLFSMEWTVFLLIRQGLCLRREGILDELSPVIRSVGVATMHGLETGTNDTIAQGMLR